ncbi:MAG: imidazole glycerol phosphate synthase subunit HisH [Kordiimonadaceae bacterium]|nr:imidazole glycerol phosphate synthase subunit HisH [Kordiimonadaceae bacterium]
MIAIVDTGIANKHSVKNALDHLGVENKVSDDPDILHAADKLIFPGVGAFSAGMQALTEKGLIPHLNQLVLEEEKPILGICLGFQLFADKSEEAGSHKGLGWIPGTIRHLSHMTEENVPHIGFNDVQATPNSRLFHGKAQTTDFYFVHSFYMETSPDYTSATASYGVPFTVAVEHENIYGVQFHPEKSKQQGLALLKNFCLGPNLGALNA